MTSTPQEAATTRRPDPERGLRGVMSAILVLEAIVILLGLPVAHNTGDGIGPVGMALICALAAAHLAACAVVKRPFVVAVVIGLQLLLVATWFLSGPLGVMGLVFLVVWVIVFAMRREFRRRLHAGLLPGHPASPPSGSDPDGDR